MVVTANILSVGHSQVNAIYEEVDITSAIQSGTTIVLDNTGHNFTLGDAIFVSGFVW